MQSDGDGYGAIDGVSQGIEQATLVCQIGSRRAGTGDEKR
jgi:hypothetical protein